MPGEFDLVHCMISDALGISIDDRFLFVLLWDRAEAMRGCALADWYRTHSSRIQNASEKDRPQVAYMARHVWGLEVAHELLLWRRAFRFREENNVIKATPLVTTRVRGAVNREVLARVCSGFALTPIFSEGAYPDHYMFEFPD